jgi:glycosyltransferase involved in cell wall biosynthesis
MLYWALFPLFLGQDIVALRARKERYAAVVASMFPMSLVARGAGAMPLVSYVLEPFAFFHDPDMIAGYPLIKRQLLRALALVYKPLDVAGIRASTEILTINAGTADWVQRIYGRASQPTLLGVDTELFTPRTSRFAARYAGKKVIIHSTDFTPLKRTLATLDAVADIRAEVPAVQLLITCSQDLPSEMARLQAEIDSRGVREHVEILGHVEHADLPHYYALADVSLYTGVGRGASAASLFVLECMAAGTPGVRTNFTNDEVQNGISGFLVPPDDRAAVRDALVAILTNDELRARFAAAARRHVVERYSWDQVAARFVDSLAPLVSSAVRSG